MTRPRTHILRRAWRAAPLATALLALSGLAVLLFAARLALFVMIGPGSAPPDQPLAGWMTPRYIAHSWHVPPEVLRRALGTPEGQPAGRRNLTEIAGDAGIPLPDLVARIEAEIAAFRAMQGDDRR